MDSWGKDKRVKGGSHRRENLIGGGEQGVGGLSEMVVGGNQSGVGWTRLNGTVAQEGREEKTLMLKKDTTSCKGSKRGR